MTGSITHTYTQTHSDESGGGGGGEKKGAHLCTSDSVLSELSLNQ